MNQFSYFRNFNSLIFFLGLCALIGIGVHYNWIQASGRVDSDLAGKESQENPINPSRPANYLDNLTVPVKDLKDEEWTARAESPSQLITPKITDLDIDVEHPNSWPALKNVIEKEIRDITVDDPTKWPAIQTKKTKNIDYTVSIDDPISWHLPSPQNKKMPSLEINIEDAFTWPKMPQGRQKSSLTDADPYDPRSWK